MTTLAPLAANSRTTALPMPLLPPVTMATFPERSMLDSLSWGAERDRVPVCQSVGLSASSSAQAIRPTASSSSRSAALSWWK